ncbi:hypothetical protein [Mycolicibacterium celeriflavum]|uniref:Uncharacterized protein n=1 Tax=Mycolicibacterium celeriflavum TaxID=1249101 RepID=A0A7I7RC15_MYCCF|nr:hypothetical protein [Mycolicibacterium celeriflavum]BBY41801.1 hypothetical protein MCEL_00960 [Mycolicibacterium celeriflavum]
MKPAPAAQDPIDSLKKTGKRGPTSKWQPIAGHPDFQLHPDGRVRKTSNRHPVTDPFLLDELRGEQTAPSSRPWYLRCCGRRWHGSLFAARMHQAKCLEYTKHERPHAVRGRAAVHARHRTSDTGGTGDARLRVLDVPPRILFGEYGGDLWITFVPPTVADDFN